MTHNQTITKIAIFQKKEIRKIFHKGEWWFSVIDVIEALSDTDRPRKYWSDLKKKLIQEGFLEVSEKIGQFKMLAPDGKLRETDCVTTETMFRIIQTLPSPMPEMRAANSSKKAARKFPRTKTIYPLRAGRKSHRYVKYIKDPFSKVHGCPLGQKGCWNLLP